MFFTLTGRITTGVERQTWQHQPQWNVLAEHTTDQLVDVLEEQCQEIHTDLIRTNQANLENTLLDVIKGHHGKSVMTWDDP